MATLVRSDYKPELRTSFSGRVRNYNLPATSSNTMMPVFEAVTNALYAIQERFPDDWPDNGVIRITVLRVDSDGAGDHSPVRGFIVTDNGIGLTDALFNHFQELDTEYRAHKKGRGIGRLSWLKVFQNASIESTFLRSGQPIKRSFDFRLSQENPFQNYIEEESEEYAIGTQVELEGFRELFGEKALISPEDIRRGILAHFISVLAQPKRLRIELIDEGSSTNLSDYFFKSIEKGGEVTTISAGGHLISLQNMLMSKKVAPIGNSLVFCAGERAVWTRSLNEFLGMKSIHDDELGELVYIGLVSGEVFDDALNHERTGFDFGDDDFDVINKDILSNVKEFLAPYLEEKRRISRNLLERVLVDNPMYVSAIGDLDTYVASMPLNWDDTKLVQDVALKRYRAQKSLIKQVERLEANTASMSDDEFARHVSEIHAQLGDAEKAALAQYVVERRLVIQLLQARRRIDKKAGEHESEALVHEVFCPLGVTSDTLDYDDHNLWLIDDRLAYYSYVASDRPISSFAIDDEEPDEEELERRSDLKGIKAYSEGGEPDLAIFKRPMLFRRSKTPDPIVIIEFKAPGKTSYTGAIGDNPVWQIRKYIESLQNKKCYDHEGNRITDIKNDTPFHCFLVAEPSTQLDALLRAHSIYKPTPDGHGRFGYFDDLNAYFEFIPYDQFIENAKLRNEAFFKRLNLVDDLTLSL